MQSWREKRNYLLELIKKVSDNALGDDSVFLKEYCLFVLSEYRSCLDEAVMCFESVLGFQMNNLDNNVDKNDFERPDIRKMNLEFYAKDARNYSLYKPWMLEKSE